MRRGRFEEREGAGGEKFYRLTWDEKQCSLSSKEVLSGLFIRYLISRGKLSEFILPAPAAVSPADCPGPVKRNRSVD